MTSLTVKNLTASYKTGKKLKPVLNDLTFSLFPSEFVCLCGPNGCGKSSLLSLMAGLPSPNLQFSGQVLLGSESIFSLKSFDRARQISYMQQSENSTWDFQVFDYVLQGRFAHSNGGHYSTDDYNLAKKILCELNLSQFSDRNIHALSGGEFQKIRIARALVQQPRFMLLDEPASNLDYVYEPHLMDFLKNLAHKNNIGILVTVHDINLAYRHADKIMLLPAQKNPIFGKADDVMTLDNLKTTFGVDFQCQKIDSFQALR